MKRTDLPQTRDVVLIGGGHTHALVLKSWGMNPLPGARLTLIDPAPTAAYSGMLPGFVAGHYSREDLGIDLVRLARFAGARLILGAASGIDLAERRVEVPGRPPVAFDVASVDVGITSDMPALPGFAEHGIPAKPLTPFAKRWAAFATSGGPARVVVIGGGVAGAELAMAAAYRLQSEERDATVTLLDRSAALTETTSSGQRILRRAMAELGITLIENAPIASLTSDAVMLEDGRSIPSDFTIGAAGALPHDWLCDTGLQTTDGFLSVGPTLQTSDPMIFACGDCAHLSHDPRPKAGVYAVRQAPFLLDNIVAALTDGAMRDYHPQSDYLKLVSLGRKAAMAEKWGRGFAGAALWSWKDRIDRAFMDKLDDLPAMAVPDVPKRVANGVADALGSKPLCGGCGSKVGRRALRGGLSHHATGGEAGIAGDDAAVLVTGGVHQVMSTDHLRAFSDDPVLMARVAAVHALGDIWAMGASPQAATATIILPRLSDGLQERTLTEIMDAAAQVFDGAGASIVGGHTSVGSELTIGFTVTGLCDRPPITLAGAVPGDALILTKPIGSGVILAGDMAGAAPGHVVADCWTKLEQTQAQASAVLTQARAMTDVTGFGLAGHVLGLCEASGVGAEVHLESVPLMNGALELAHAGVASTLLPSNRSGAHDVICPEGALGDLMFDPQTAGGLLAAVPQDAVAAILTALKDAGHTAARIGTVTDRSVGVRFF